MADYEGRMVSEVEVARERNVALPLSESAPWSASMSARAREMKKRPSRVRKSRSNLPLAQPSSETAETEAPAANFHFLAGDGTTQGQVHLG